MATVPTATVPTAAAMPAATTATPSGLCGGRRYRQRNRGHKGAGQRDGAAGLFQEFECHLGSPLSRVARGSGGEHGHVLEGERHMGENNPKKMQRCRTILSGWHA
jgi:hypothetical protein